MGDEASKGLRLLAEHLASVKLQAEERDYKLKQELKVAKKRISELGQELELTTCNVEKYKLEIKELEKQGSRKELFNEREKWKKLVQTLRKDNEQLRHRLSGAEESKESGSLSSPDGDSSTAISYDAENRRPESKSIDLGLPMKAQVYERNRGKETNDTKEVIGHLKEELKAKDEEIRALRNKLDFELELKWTQSKQQQSWKQTLLDSFKEVIAPMPTPTLDAISEKGQVYEGSLDEEGRIV